MLGRSEDAESIRVFERRKAICQESLGPVKDYFGTADTLFLIDLVNAGQTNLLEWPETEGSKVNVDFAALDPSVTSAPSFQHNAGLVIASPNATILTIVSAAAFGVFLPDRLAGPFLESTDFEMIMRDGRISETAKAAFFDHHRLLALL